MVGQGGSSTIDIDALIEEKMDDGDRHVSLEPLTPQRAMNHTVADDVAQGLVVAEDEIDRGHVRLAFRGQHGVLGPEAGCVRIEDYDRAVLPFPHGRREVATAVGDADRDGLPVTDGREWRGDDLADGSCYRTFICVESLEFCTVEFNASRWAWAAQQVEDHLGVRSKPVAREQSGHERPNDDVHAPACTC